MKFNPLIYGKLVLNVHGQKDKSFRRKIYLPIGKNSKNGYGYFIWDKEMINVSR